MAVPVAVALAIQFIVLRLIADEIAQGEAVVRGDEVDTRLRRASRDVENLARSGKALRQFRHTRVVGQPERAHVVPEAVIPLAPAGQKTPQTVPIRSDVPGFGDQLDPLQHGILPDRGEKRAVARQRRSEIEAEAVYVHHANPVAQRIHDQLQNPRMGEIDRVATAGEIFVVREMAGRQAVVAQVVDAAERECGAFLVAFGGMVEDHVKNDFKAGGVQRPDHGLEFGNHRLPTDACRVARLRGKETD